MHALWESQSMSTDHIKDTGRRLTWGTRFARLRVGLLAVLVTCFVLGGPLSALAQQYLVVAKAANQIGEKLDGYLGVVDPDTPEKYKKAVEAANERRKGRYGTIAEKRGTTVESVGRQAGEKLISRAKPGEWVESAEGKWVKKK